MITAQLYIGTVKMDLFGDETITIIDSIQDARDISKVKTAFTKTFNLPPSQTNNKVFKYYQNPHIQNSFDARYRTTASIHLDGILFRKGSVRLMGVNMKNGDVSSYQVSFVGNTITLPDALGDDTLDQLDLSAYTHDYNEATVRTGLQTSISSGVIRYPLIYHTTRYYYTTQFTDGTNALDYSELKPAIQLKALTDQIETQYDSITWAASIHWDDTDFAKLYMWLHRDEGDVIGGDELQQVEIPYSEWSYSSGGGDITPIVTNLVYVSPADITTTTYAAKFSITTTGTGLYNVYVIDEVSGGTIAQWLKVTGTATYTANMGSGTSRTWEPKVIVSTEGGITAVATITLELTRTVDDSTSPPSVDTVSNYTNSSQPYAVLSEIVVQSQIPQMKIIDFLTSLFKMSNLTAYLNDADEIVVETLDDFYARAVERDISKYIIRDSHTVNRTVPFSKIEYKFADPSTKLIIEWNRENAENVTDDGRNQEFGNLEYTDTDQKYDGGSYIVDVGFEKMVYEAQFSTADVQTDLTSGWFVDKKDEPVIGAPLVMYIENTSCSTNQIRWLTASNSTTYNRPSNSSSTNTINFNAEIDEHTLAVKTTSLFSEFHDNYISNIFNQYARIYSYKAQLPLSFILNYKLYDIIIIDNLRYRINKIKINLTTGFSSLDLINIT